MILNPKGIGYPELVDDQIFGINIDEFFLIDASCGLMITKKSKKSKKNYDIFKLVFRKLMITALIGVLLAVILLVPHLTKAGYNSEVSNAKKEDNLNYDPPIIVSMKTTMYEYVTDDADIEKMARWIKEGCKNNKFFRDVIFPMMKNDCANCHSASSTMTDAAPDIPLSRYEDIKKSSIGE